MVIDMYPAHILESGEIQTVREHCRSTAELLAFAAGAHHGLFDCIGVHQDSGFFHRQTKEGIGYEESVQNYLKECVDAATLDSLFQQSVQEISAVIEGDRRDTAEFMDGVKLPPQPEDMRPIWTEQLAFLEQKLSGFSQDKPINRARQTIPDFKRRNNDGFPSISGAHRL